LDVAALCNGNVTTFTDYGPQPAAAAAAAAAAVEAATPVAEAEAVPAETVPVQRLRRQQKHDSGRNKLGQKRGSPPKTTKRQILPKKNLNVQLRRDDLRLAMMY
jgi:hypothetical protein